MLRKTASFLRDVWALSRPYWSSEERWAARGLLLVIVALNLGLVYINVLLNDWNREFFNALQAKRYDDFMSLMVQFTVLAGLFILIGVYALYLRQMLQIRWRRWLTDRYLQRWLAHRVYYRMQLAGDGADNPDQRIAEDVRDFVENTLVLMLDLMSTAVTLVTFLVILWSLSGSLAIPLGGWALEIPGYLVWAALLYAVLGTWITHRVGRPLVPLNFDRQRFEADFRFSLVRFRENAESVALYSGEARETRSLRSAFGAIATNWWELMGRQKRLSFFTYGYGQAAIVFPYFVAAPRYFFGGGELGELTQTAGAFSQVQTSLSWFVDNYPKMAVWKATVDRLITFSQAMENAEAAGVSGPAIRHEPVAGLRDIRLRDFSLALPSGQDLLRHVSFDLRAGEAVLLSGPSGCGKSTLFRAIAGIWPYGAGRIERPADASILFLPQRPYLPIDSLRAVLTYPAAADGADDGVLVELLRACALPHLATHLNEQAHWAQRLSPGEQQRIAFARALLHKPDWLFLDEATAALDEPIEAMLYGLVRDRLPGTTIVSIGHRPTLRAFHARQVAIRAAEGGLVLEDVPIAAIASAE